jgi:hypothetical protein
MTRQEASREAKNIQRRQYRHHQVNEAKIGHPEEKAIEVGAVQPAGILKGSFIVHRVMSGMIDKKTHHHRHLSVSLALAVRVQTLVDDRDLLSHRLLTARAPQLRLVAVLNTLATYSS